MGENQDVNSVQTSTQRRNLYKYLERKAEFGVRGENAVNAAQTKKLKLKVIWRSKIGKREVQK